MVVLVFVASCGGGGGGGGGGGDEVTVSLTTSGGATDVASGGTLVIKADVANTSSNMDVSWALSGAGCASDCGTITRTSIDFATYAAPADVATPFSVTVTATSIEDTTKRASVVLAVKAKVCPAGTTQLNGPYAFLLQGFDPANGKGIAAVGSLTADGCGAITSGSVDYYFGPTLDGDTTAVSGSYSVGADRRGSLSLAVGPATKTFAIALGKLSGGVAFKGALTETTAPAAGATVLSGSMWRQDASAFALGRIAGPYAFVFNGWNGAGPRAAMGGTVTATGSGAFSGGLLDTMTFGGSPVAGTAWSATFAAPSAAGRSALVGANALAGAGGSAVIYVVDASRILAMVSNNSAAGRVFSGSLVAQTGPFDLASLSGNCVSYQTANYDQPGYSQFTTSVLATFSADGAGRLSLTSADQNFGGNIARPSGIEYTYTVAANGHASIYAGTAVGGKWYLTGPNSALMLGYDAGVSVGMILPQSGAPFSAASISGNYLASQAPGGSLYSTVGSGVASSAGTGTLASTLDLDTAGAILTGQGSSGTLGVSAGGRTTDSRNNVIYVVSPDSFVMMNLATGYPVIQIFER